MNKKIEVLLKIATEFKKKNICWGVGGSLLLSFKGITDVYNDIDIIIDEKDVLIADKVLMSLGNKNKSTNKTNFDSDYFLNYDISGVNLDVIGNFKIINNEHLYLFNFDEDYDLEYKIVNNILIPLTHVEDWYELYKYMNRNSKIKLIESSYSLNLEYRSKVIKLK